MISEESLRRATLFFYYIFLDAETAESATQQCIAAWEKKTLEGEKENFSDFVRISLKIWQKNFQHQKKPINLGNALALPSGLQLGEWMDFRKKVNADIFLTLAWSEIAGVSEEDIALGQQESLGTVRSRLNSGFLKLGECCGS